MTYERIKIPFYKELEYGIYKSKIYPLTKVERSKFKVREIYFEFCPTNPFLIKGILSVGCTSITTIDSIKAGDYDYIERPIPAFIFQLGINIEFLQELIKNNNTIAAPDCINFDFKTINIGQILKIKTSGPIDYIHIWGIERIEK